jgi:hypothetical protein
MCSSSWAAVAISSSKSLANICSSSFESMSAQANGRTPVGRVDEARREELPDSGI